MPPPSFRPHFEKTDVYVSIACRPTRRAGHRQTLHKARAIENQAFMVGRWPGLG